MMNEKTKTGLEILQAAVLLGVLGDVLLANALGIECFAVSLFFFFFCGKRLGD